MLAIATYGTPALAEPYRCPHGPLYGHVNHGCRPLADIPAEFEDFFDQLGKQKHLTGDWGGTRTELYKQGFMPSASFALNVATNPVGGTSYSAAQANSTGVELALDFERFADIPGLLAFFSFAYRNGTSLARTHFPQRPTDRGGLLPIAFQQVYGGQTWHLINVYLQETASLFHHRDFSIKVGRLAQLMDFARDMSVQYYMNNAFNGQPHGFFDQGIFYAYPEVTWGAVAAFAVPLAHNQGLWARAGVYGTDTSPDIHGTRWSFSFNRGANVMVELGYKRNWLLKNIGMPSKVVIGGWVTTGEFPKWQGGEQKGIAGGYYLVNQALFVEATKPKDLLLPSAGVAGLQAYWGTSGLRLRMMQGLFFWSTGQFAGSSTSAMDRWVEFGAYYRGLIPGRDKDVLAVALYYGWFSDDLGNAQRAAGAPPQTFESALELDYRLYLADYFYLQPNIQGIFNPGGSHQFGDALIIGMQSVLDL